MKFACIGVAKKEGTFNDRHYSNYVFYFTDLEDKQRLAGIIPYVASGKPVCWKVKTSEWDPKVNPTDYCNKKVDLTFDAYRNVASVKILEG